MLLGYPGAEATLNSAVLETDCDVLVLAASPQQVTMSNAPNIRAKVLLEITPQAIASEARALLPDTGMIVSDLVCGGIAPLYYATESSRVELATSHRPILRRAIRRTWASVAEAATRWHLPHHAAAEMLAINRVATALRARGH
jgi:glutamate dehydrogenase/leucine dehydrogenase